MAIKNIPQIYGPNFGGLIYSLNLKSSYSTAPSTLSLRVVNSTGQYSTPILNQQATINFGSFIFRGIIWSYTFTKDAGESILEVELKDNSVILDRRYVMLWRRGLLGAEGTKETALRTVDLKEKILIPVLTGDYNVQLRIKELADQQVSRTRYSNMSRRGSVILLGREDWPDTICDIPDTTYTFNDLMSNLGISSSNAPSSDLEQTYEGTLREVLNSWCSDLGYDFYWDYSSDRLVFYNTAAGLGSVPSFSSPNVISSSYSKTMEGSFAQFGVAYSAKPKSPSKELSGATSMWATTNVNPVPYSYFVNRIGKTSSTAGSESSVDSASVVLGRSAREVLNTALLGHASRSLRDFWIFTNKGVNGLPLLGYSKVQALNTTKMVDLLRLIGYAQAIESLEVLFGKGLPKHKAYISSYDENVAESIVDGEAEVLDNVGRWYKIPKSSGSAYYCTNDAVVQIDFSVDPEPDIIEPNSPNFSGKKMHDRGGSLSANILSLQDTLQSTTGDFVTKIQQCMPFGVPLKEAGIATSLLQAKLVTEADLKKYNMLLLIPDENFAKQFVQAKITFGRSQNPSEATYKEIAEARDSSGDQECSAYEDKLKSTQCQSAIEEAREKAMKQAMPTTDTGDGVVSGLVSKNAFYCKIDLGSGGKGEVHAPADGQLRVVMKWSADAKKIDTTNTSQIITSVGSVGSADSFSEIRVNVDNVTSSEDQFGFPVKNIQTTPNITCGHQSSATYTFAGEPQGISLSPSNGLSDISITVGNDGFTTTLTYNTRAPKPPKANSIMRTANSQLNRASFNAN
jgi:hypothetical protein